LELTDVAGNFITGETIDGDISGQAKIDGNPVAGTGSLVNDALSSPLAVDMEGDFISDRIYVGNLYGNMYRVTNIGKNMTPEVTTLFSFGNSSPNENPIRAKANYGFGSTNGDVWIYFGSGRYESQADKQDDHQQYFFGLKDSIIPEAPYTLSDLVSLQAKFATTTIDGASVSVRVIEGSNSLVLPWKLQLYEKTFSGGPAASGTERVVSQPLVVGGLVIFTSFIPDEDICAGSGETWVFAVDFKSGLAPTTPIFDLNGDKLFNEDDKVEVEGEKVVPVGIYVGRGKGSKPVLHKNILFITTTGDGVVALGDDTNSGQEFFAQKINIKNQTVRLEAWRHK
jgi:type IV pilus assembly protein PilY1